MPGNDRFLPLKCLTEQQQQSLSRQAVTELNSEIRNKKGKLKILISKHLKTQGKFLLEGFGF